MKGEYAEDPKMKYILGTVSILVTTALVPLSLKLFSMMMEKRIKTVSLVPAMKRYKNWNAIRLLLLGIVVLVNVFIYYSTKENVGGLCALIGITASLFCFPGKKKIKEELDITNKIEE